MDPLSYVSPARRLRERELKREAEVRKKVQADRFKSLGKGDCSYAEMVALHAELHHQILKLRP